MAQHYVVQLEAEERESLSRLIHTGKGAARKLTHARILLHADQAADRPRLADEEIAAAIEVSDDTVARIRRRFVEEGLEAALERRPTARPPRARLIDGEAEAKLVAICCGGPPEGRARWTLRLLADKLVELEILESVSHETGQLETFDHEYTREGVGNLFMFCEPLAGRRRVRIKLKRLYPVLRL